MDLTPLQRLERATVSLIRDKDYMWLAGIIIMGEVKITNDDTTARTDGLNVEYGRSFIRDLSDQELMGLVLHESMHKAFMHLTTWQHLYDKDAELANMACDYVINLPIKDRHDRDGFVALPEGGCVDEKYRDMDAGEVFALLEKNPPTGRKDGFDEHDWKNAKQRTADENKELTKAVEQILRHGNILASKAGANVDRGIAEMLDPKVDWAEVLREFITNSKQGDDYSSYRRIDTRLMSQDVTLPTEYSDHAHRVTLAIDTSGSIGQKELAAFLAEAQGVCSSCRPEIVDILYWGHIVAKHETYDENGIDTMRESTRPMGGGGTEPSCITQYMREQNIMPDCVVVLTDGEVGGDWGGEWPVPVLWCITNKRISAPVGITTHM